MLDTLSKREPPVLRKEILCSKRLCKVDPVHADGFNEPKIVSVLFCFIANSLRKYLIGILRSISWLAKLTLRFRRSFTFQSQRGARFPAPYLILTKYPALT